MILRTQTLLRIGLGTALVSVTACGSSSPEANSGVHPTPAGSAAQSAPVLAAVAGSRAPKIAATTPAANGGSSVPTPAAASPAASRAAPAAAVNAVAAPKAGELPCGVSAALKKNCQSCHGASPIGGAPMSLVTYADFLKPAYSQPSMKVYELSKLRLNDKAKPMPPGGGIAAEELAALDTWLSGGAMPASPAEVACGNKPDATAGFDEPTSRSMEPLVALPGETCYEFKTHAAQDSVDNMPYQVVPGEHYTSFYFKAPWPDGSVATRYGTRFDNLKVLHHWLLFSTDETNPEGSWAVSPLPTLNGVGASLVAGWAVGGTNLEMPQDVGFELPPKGKQLNVQWHYYNTTSEMQSDLSAVQVCTVPAGTRPHTASITWVGTEDIGGNKWFGGAGMPPHQQSEYQGTCTPLREGMGASEPIHIVGFWPHMHQLGTNMQAFVNHKDGTKEKIFEKPFDFNHQIHYLHPYELQPGDSLTAVCRYNNTTNSGVPYGESSDTEMCYNFTIAWPAHALDNHVPSLIGASNTCW